MRFEQTTIAGVYIINIDPVEDVRGFFARLWCRDEAMSRGLVADFAQTSVSFNARVGTTRGMHYQAAPHQEVKLVRCTAGAIYDVVIDLRPDSPTYAKWFAAELTARNRRTIYVPKGVAHGFQTLRPDTEVLYHISEAYIPQLAGGVRWNDPLFAIDWPRVPTVISDRDSSYPDLSVTIP